MAGTKLYLLKTLVKRNLYAWYGGSLLGFFWAVLNPLLTVGLYLMVFGFFLKLRLDKALHGTEDFSLWLVAGLLPWLSFSESVGSGAFSIKNNGHLLKRMKFPSEILPIAFVCSVFINHLAYLGVVTAVSWALHGLNPRIAYLLLFVPLLFSLSLGLTLLTSALSVYIRDLTLVLPLALQVWFFMTPIIYPYNLVPEGALRISVDMNPMRWIVEGYRCALFGHTDLPVANTLALAAEITLLVFISVKIFQRLKEGFVDVL